MTSFHRRCYTAGRIAFTVWMIASMFLSPACGVTKDMLDEVKTKQAKMKLQAPKQPSAILHELECFKQMGSALYIAAHPDDENTELLAYLSRGRNYRTAYLSLTRGDGGQNVLGSDLDEKLGVARTQELIAARKIDGARQFFSRANDFGFSKNYQETLAIWDKQEVLSDIVRVIRQFRPDVIITRFSPSPGGTHGHHTASAVLALEAFKLAGDAKAFPEQRLLPWQPRRILWNVSIFQRDKFDGSNSIKIDTGGKDPVSGEAFVEIARQSRSMHKTQGFDQFHFPGGSDGPRSESFQFLDGLQAKSDIMDGVDTTWNRVKGGSVIAKAIDEVIADFNTRDVSANAPALLRLRKAVQALPGIKSDPVLKEKQALLDRILADCLGLQTETTVAHHEVEPGETMSLHHSVRVGSNTPVRWVALRYPSIHKEIKRGDVLKPGAPQFFKTVERLPDTTPLTNPYWLQEAGTRGMVRVLDQNLIGTPENGPVFPVENVFEIAGQRIVLFDEPEQVVTDSTGRETHLRLNVIPPVWLRFTSNIALMQPRKSRSVEVELQAARANLQGTVRLLAPSGWGVAPHQQSFHLGSAGEKTRLKFTITAPGASTSTIIGAEAQVRGRKYGRMREEIAYPHLPLQLLQAPAAVQAVSVDLSTRAHTIGYLPGAGDVLPEAMEQMGCKVSVLDDSLTADKLAGLDAVVLGVRAFNVRDKIDNAMPALFDYVRNGGVVLVQYNRSDGLKTTKLAPYELHLSRQRVTNETARMTFLAPESAALNSPNRISEGDFDGWVQERGLYFADKWDKHFTPILSCGDQGEEQLQGGLLVAPYGKGFYIYSGLAFFRQLPAGVPGAYRLLANLLSYGK